MSKEQIIAVGKDLLKGILSKPENPMKTGAGTTLGGMIALPTTGLSVALANQAGIDSLPQLILTIVGLVVSYALSQYKKTEG